jgi:hypothetical protein
MRATSEQANDFIQDLGNAVRNNPISAALIGMGWSGFSLVEREGRARSSEFVA